MSYTTQLGPFGGIVQSLSATFIPRTSAQDARNVRIENGDLATRYGWTNFAAARAGFTSVLGMDFAPGWVAGAYTNAFLAVLGLGGTRKPFELSLAGAWTEITDGGTPLALPDGDYVTKSFNGDALVLRRGGELYRHSVGVFDSWDQVDAPRPANLTGSVNLSFETAEDLSAYTPGPNVSWATATAANVLDDGTANNSAVFDSVAGTTLVLDRQWITNAGIPPMIHLAPVGAPLDWSAQDQITITTEFEGLTGGGLTPELQYPIAVQLRNADGSPKTVNMDVTTEHLNLGSGKTKTVITAKFPAGTTMSDWDNVAEVRFTLHPQNNAAGTGTLKVQQIALGTVATGAGPGIGTDPYRVRFGLVSYDGERDIESADVLWGDYRKLDPAQRWFSDAGTAFLGNIPTVAAIHSGEPQVTACRVYVQFEDDQIARFVGGVKTSDTGLKVDKSYGVLRALPARLAHDPTPVGAATCMSPFKAFMVYGYDQAGVNIKMSAINQPGRLARSTDSLSDKEAGASFVLADGFDDAPQELIGAGDVLFALGRRAVYASYGNIPGEMSPFRIVPKTLGVLGRVACMFMGDDGIPGVAYVGTDQEIWFVQAVAGVREDFGYPVYSLTEAVRGMVRDKLTQTASPDVNKLRIGIDERTDSLWLTYENRAMVLRRANLIDGKRAWEFYEYAGGPWLRSVFADRFGHFALRASGAVDIFEFTTSGAAITGTNRDGGSAMPQARWKSPKMLGVRRRVRGAKVTKPAGATATVEVASDDLIRAYAYAGAQPYRRFSQNQTGRDVVVTVLLGEADGPVSLIALEEFARQERRDEGQ
jgi:hypothetical protein